MMSKRKVDIKAVASNIDLMTTLVQAYGGDPKRMPQSARQDVIELGNRTLELLEGTPVPEPSLDVINGASPYFSNPALRGMEVQAASASLGAKSKESAYKYLCDRLQTAIQLPPENLNQKVNLLLELELERLLQNPATVDLRNISIVKEAYREAVNRWRQEAYNSLITQDWQTVLSRYDQTNAFYFDLGDVLVYPTMLNPYNSEPDLRFSTRPAQQLGTVYAYDIEEERFARRTEEEVNQDTPYSHISVGHLRNACWKTGCYGNGVEKLYGGFKGMIDAKLEEFRRTHGGAVTPVLIIPASDVRLHVGSDQILMGWRIEVKKAEDGGGQTLTEKLVGFLNR